MMAESIHRTKENLRVGETHSDGTGGHPAGTISGSGQKQKDNWKGVWKSLIERGPSNRAKGKKKLHIGAS